MEPIRRGQLEQNISSATVEFLDTGETKSLKTKSDSVCHFFELFQVDNDTIQLRLDWSELDTSGHPTLDADFFDSQTGKRCQLKGARRDAHHTSTINSESRSYEWEYRNVRRPFKIIVCWIASITENAHVTDSVTAEVIRAGKAVVNF